ncbi:BgTH12-06962 [Blumeria graminis f. sp. triticale]|uniref:BgTH12-06962 n=1 Tax=Blumeria graminis f. sp. triticale TaxID=1689686 RepID=A0A9W4GJL2_BLUGR|nr:BgTH12-06962 [Blumeria graminis f. sp. triticale]
MWIKFCISLFITGLIHQVKCIDTPYSDMYLPDGTNGFLCETEFLSIEYARQEKYEAMESFFYERRFQTFPKLFEDTHLFNVKTDILLSWPVKPSGKIYIKDPGKFRIIINIRGQIMGMVVIVHDDDKNKVSFEKCKPVRSSVAEEDFTSSLLDEYWSLAYPTNGFRCGSKYFPLSIVKSGNDPNSDYYFKNALAAKSRRAYFGKYSGDQFIGSDLRTYPLHHSSTSEQICGPHGRFRAVFDMTNREFKGIIDVKAKDVKCVCLGSTIGFTRYNLQPIFYLKHGENTKYVLAQDLRWT